MKISIKVHPKSKKEKVAELSDGGYEVWVNAPPDKGRANEAVINILSEHLGIAKTRISILRGLQSKTKLIEIS